jgi:hypothetical protein
MRTTQKNRYGLSGETIVRATMRPRINLALALSQNRFSAAC